MKRAYVVLILLVCPFVLHAAEVYIWNFDPLDTFYDSQIETTVDCSYWLEQALSGNGHELQIGETLPAELGSYDIIYVTLGWYRC